MMSVFKRMPLAFLAITLCLSACSSLDNKLLWVKDRFLLLPGGTTTPTYTADYTGASAPATEDLQESETPDDTPESTAVPEEEAATSIPVVYPGEGYFPYLKIFPDLQSLQYEFWRGFKVDYEITRLTGRYTIRAVYRENMEPNDGITLVESVTVAEPGLVSPDMQAILQPEAGLQKVDYPPLGDASQVMTGRQFIARVVKGNILVEVIMDAGHKTFSTDLAYRLAGQILANLPADMPAPDNLTLDFPPVEAQNTQKTVPLDEIALWVAESPQDTIRTVDLAGLADLELKFTPQYPIKEMFIAWIDANSGQCVSLKYNHGSFMDFYHPETAKETLYRPEPSAVFDTVPPPGDYKIKLWVDGQDLFKGDLTLTE